MAKPDSAGTSVAVSPLAMRLSETIIIYLATGAPFSVSYFLHKRERERTIRGFLGAVAAGVLWPFTALRILVAEYSHSTATTLADRASRKHEENIQYAKRRLLASLHALSELATSAGGRMNKELERVACVLRESVETYVGLAGAVEGAAVGISQTEHALDFFRIAGLKGDDLMLATRCAQRRNIARIIEHHSRARVQLVNGIADIREAVERTGPSKPANGLANARLRLETVEIYKHAFNLLSLMGDQDAAMRIAKLVNQERSQLRRSGLTEAHAESPHETGEEPCTANTSRPTHAPLPNEATMAQG